MVTNRENENPRRGKQCRYCSFVTPTGTVDAEQNNLFFHIANDHPDRPLHDENPRDIPNNGELYVQLQSVQTSGMDVYTRNWVFINNDELRHTPDPYYWLTDYVMDVGFEGIADVTDTKAHRIAMIDSVSARELYRIGCDPDVDMKANDGTVNRAAFLKAERYATNKNIKERLRGNDFLFIPISNGYNTNKFLDDSGKAKVAGSHWSLLVIDVRGGKHFKGRYFDSLTTVCTQTMGGNCHCARMVYKGVCNMLESMDPTSDRNKPEPRYFETEQYMPNQARDDVCGLGGGSACGVFAWAAAKELVLYIIECEEDEFELPDELQFTEDFKREVRWNSKAIRRVIYELIIYEKEKKQERERGWYRSLAGADTNAV